MNMYIQLSSGLKKITNEITSAQIINALGYQPVNKNELNNIFNSESDTFYVTDANGNIIAKIDNEGLHTTEVKVGSGLKVKEHIQNTFVHVTEEDRQKWNAPALENIEDDESAEFNIADGNGNVIMRVDAGGIHTTKLYLNEKEVNVDDDGEISVSPLPPVDASNNDQVLKVVDGKWEAAAVSPSSIQAENSDNGKMLQVVNGEWTAADLVVPTNSIQVEKADEDNGRILQVIDGQWTAADLAVSPNSIQVENTDEDNGKILQVVDGKWTATVPPSELPKVENPDEDNGKILQVVNGEWTAADLIMPSSGLPEIENPNEDNGKILQVANGQWTATPQKWTTETWTFVFENGSITKTILVGGSSETTLPEEVE